MKCKDKYVLEILAKHYEKLLICDINKLLDIVKIGEIYNVR